MSKEFDKYASKSVFKKTIFNLGFQVAPIALALLIMPLLINNLGKDFWAKYTAGISLVFLSNYFSFGIGPTLNRRVSELVGIKENHKIGKEMNECIALSYLLGIGFFFVLMTILSIGYWGKFLSILQSSSDFYFYILITTCFFLTLVIIPYKSALEAFSDFYFLSIVRATISSSLFLVPLFLWSVNKCSLVNCAWALLFLYMVHWIIYYLRFKKHKSIFEFKSSFRLKIKEILAPFKSFSSFFKEALGFSLFFICSATVLFFDRFYYPIFFNTEILSDHFTMLDLFNRVAIITGTISLVYFSAISVWFNNQSFDKIKKILKRQFLLVGFFFLSITLTTFFFLNDLMFWWLKDSFSDFIANTSFKIMVGVLIMNFSILIIRPLQAIGKMKEVNRILLGSTILFLVLVVLFGVFERIEYHYVAFFVKGVFDIILLLVLLRKQRLL
ncbi:hypothetical protein MTsPCn9_15240 [Croceitalea sp. MTPC9]|uniref:hypothetical protein n=1 Tax=unclassified Croceitalea TaxID=2632280 RepID=UPI002B3C3E6B|nr:hypothetical protein MTsPCn6_13890 [Croceitalea sp. MTPC6]GMN16588.1 hypothetical protein MTsPCn9_15240 [Croceitalea sp. MTPC9]